MFIQLISYDVLIILRTTITMFMQHYQLRIIIKHLYGMLIHNTRSHFQQWKLLNSNNIMTIMITIDIYICTNNYTITNNTTAYNNEFGSIRRIDSPINDFMVIFHYLLNQIYKNHDCIITSITIVIIFLLIIRTTDNNSITIINCTNAMIKINNYCSNTFTTNGTNTTNTITTKCYKDLISTTNLVTTRSLPYTFNIDAIYHQMKQVLYYISNNFIIN